ncbi:hypothetical protein PG987_012860 [Apiospora arundinis]
MASKTSQTLFLTVPPLAINLLTPDVVKEASHEIQTGRHVQLDWPLESIKHPGFARVPLKHRLLDNYVSLKEYALDDELEFNTQGGSQWDSLKHYAYQKKQVYYNGLTFEEAKKSITNGLHNFCDRGGIVGRGVLIDMVRYWNKIGQELPNPWSSYKITVKELEAALADQGTTLKQGDILLVRSGYVKRHNEASEEECKAGTQGATSIGVEPCEDGPVALPAPPRGRRGRHHRLRGPAARPRERVVAARVAAGLLGHAHRRALGSRAARRDLPGLAPLDLLRH